MRLAIIALAAGASCLGAAAIAARTSPLTTPAPPSGTGVTGAECFRVHEIQNRVIADDHTMLVNVDGRATYRLTMKGRCLATATNSDPISTRALPGTSRICKPADMDISISQSGSIRPCLVDSIAKMSPAEAAALPKKYQP